MIKKIAIVCLAISSVLPSAFGQSTKPNPETNQSSQTSQNSQKNAQPSTVVQITTINARKMPLSVKDDAPEGGPTAQAATGSTRRRSGRARKSSSGGNQARQYKIYLTKDTVFKDGDTIISFSSLNVGDRVVVTGSANGTDIQAAQVVRNSK